jgi:hypothetical protein
MATASVDITGDTLPKTGRARPDLPVFPELLRQVHKLMQMPCKVNKQAKQQAHKQLPRQGTSQAGHEDYRHEQP